MPSYSSVSYVARNVLECLFLCAQLRFLQNPPQLTADTTRKACTGTLLASVDSSGRFFFSLAAFTLSMSFPAAACRAAELGTLSSGPLGA